MRAMGLLSFGLALGFRENLSRGLRQKLKERTDLQNNVIYVICQERHSGHANLRLHWRYHAPEEYSRAS
jgi:hypothetical protein